MRPINVVTLAGLLLVSAQANAQIKVGTHQAGLNLGLVHPLSRTDLGGETERFGETGPVFGFSYLYQFRPNFSFGGDFNYKFLGTQNYPNPHGGAEVRSSVWTMLAIGRVDPLPENRLRPYGLVGMGLGGARRSLEFPSASRYDSARTSTGLAFALGGGADYDIDADWLVGGELRYGIISTSRSDIGAGSVSSMDMLFKLGYKFGPL